MERHLLKKISMRNLRFSPETTQLIQPKKTNHQKTTHLTPSTNPKIIILRSLEPVMARLLFTTDFGRFAHSQK